MPVALPVVPRPVAAPTGPSSNVATASVATPVTALTTSTTSATSRLMAGMSPAGNIPSGASDQEKVFKNKLHIDVIYFYIKIYKILYYSVI